MKNRIVKHKNLGIVVITDDCLTLQKENSDKTTLFIEYGIEIREVSKDLIEEYPIINIGSIWKHNKNNMLFYTVMLLANEYSSNLKYPVTIIYQGTNNKIWAKTIDNFLETMDLVND